MPTLTTGNPDVFQGHPRIGFPLSVGELKRAQLRGPLYDYLRNFASRDVCHRFDDFDRLAIDSTNQWGVANGGGAGVASFATNTQVNGVIRGTTGTANGVTASASLIGPVIYPGTSNPGIEIRFRVITSILAIKMDVGFIDAVPGGTTNAINNMDTPTAFMANGATVSIDTAATAANFNLVTIGSATNQAIKKTNGTVGIAVAGTYMTVRVQLYSRDASTANAVDVAAWKDGQVLAVHDTSATAGVGAVNGSVLLAPWAYIQATSATSKSMEIDYIHTWCDRGVV